MASLPQTSQQRLHQALRAYRAGNSIEAEKICLQVISTASNFFDALHLLAVIQASTGNYNAALATYDRARSLQPNHAEALNNRGVTLYKLGRYDDALASYDRALSFRPDYVEALHNMGVVLTIVGRAEKARNFIESAIRLSPKIPMFYLSLSKSHQFAVGDPCLAAMQKLAENMGALSAAGQIQLHFALGKALRDVKKHEESFRHLLQGNALKRRQIDYDEAAMLGLFQRIQTVFTPELVRGKGGLGNPSEVPIFILGMPRSGSTLVEQILASHPKVFGAGELDHFSKAGVRLHPPVPFPEGIAAVSGNQLHQLGTHYLDATKALAPEAVRITDKMPMNFRFVGLIHLALPHARIIHTRRDPVDTCLSCFSTLFADGNSFSYDLGELGRYYHAYEALMRHWRNVLPDEVMLEVQYEDVVDDLEGQARRLVAHCGLEWDDACLNFHKTQRPVQTASAAQVRQPIYRSSIGHWRPSQDLLHPLLHGLNPEPADRSR